jgi:hypothetical protein
MHALTSYNTPHFPVNALIYVVDRQRVSKAEFPHLVRVSEGNNLTLVLNIDQP